MEKLQWFKFYPSDYMMGKIQRCPEITQARFIRLCCLYWNKECNLNITDSIIEIDKEHFDILIYKNIITANEEHIFIDFLDEQLIGITEVSKGKSKAAKARWAKYNEQKNNADAMHVHTDAMQNDAEERREEKRILNTRSNDLESISFNWFWNTYDKKVDRTKCEAKFKKLSFKEKEKIKEVLPAYIKTKSDIQFRKNPLTWLNGKCWNDEIEQEKIQEPEYDLYTDSIMKQVAIAKSFQK